MKSKNTFDILLLIARPAAGKSEIIDHLKNTAVEDRKKTYHIGEFEEIDDFPMLSKHCSIQFLALYVTIRIQIFLFLSEFI